jgi:uncharacterized membrane protein HdeD (DUF308 family)
MKEVLARNWWVFVVRGVLAVAFGVGAFALPGMTLKALVLVYGAYALADGVMAAVCAFGRHRPGDDFPWSMLFVGLAGIVAGVLTFFFPGLTALVLLYLIAAWHVVRGTFEIAAAIRLRKEIEGEGWLILAGALSVLFGLFLYVRPGAGALALVWTIGAFAIAFGLITLLLGFRLRKVTPAS